MPSDFTGKFNMDEKCFVLSWEPPKEDGGKPVIGYGLEYCSIMGTKWVHAAIVKGGTCWKGSNYFTGGMMYRFRVNAHNEKGLGETCELGDTIKFLCKCFFNFRGKTHSIQLFHNVNSKTCNSTCCLSTPVNIAFAVHLVNDFVSYSIKCIF